MQTAIIFESLVKGYAAEQGLKIGDLFPIFRLALTGTMQGPDLFDTFAILGGLLLRWEYKTCYTDAQKFSHKDKADVHKELKGFEIRINSFGEMEKQFEHRQTQWISQSKLEKEEKEKVEKSDFYLPGKIG